MDVNKLICFHDFKHHLHSDINWLIENESKWNEEVDLQLKSIGDSVLDYYTGILSPEQIKEEVYIYLQDQNLLEKNVYDSWIRGNSGYREIVLSDGSTWVLRTINKQSFIHIHPGRRSKYTLRVKANTLKTVLCALLFEDIDLFKFDLNLINIYRDNYLDLSRIKIINRSRVLTRCEDDGNNVNEMKNIFKLVIDRLAWMRRCAR
ncbi:MAG: hypothetical protein E6767_03825 [Dysgonomonas sp.]|nr:hypothetical protein [Dysgonomonas sp.]